ncbi:hypothetical protein HK096_004595, partial [Nowakowskiella sp. JEL0078]
MEPAYSKVSTLENNPLEIHTGYTVVQGVQAPAFQQNNTSLASAYPPLQPAYVTETKSPVTGVPQAQRDQSAPPVYQPQIVNPIDYINNSQPQIQQSPMIQHPVIVAPVPINSNTSGPTVVEPEHDVAYL